MISSSQMHGNKSDTHMRKAEAFIFINYFGINPTLYANISITLRVKYEQNLIAMFQIFVLTQIVQLQSLFCVQPSRFEKIVKLKKLLKKL